MKVLEYNENMFSEVHWTNIFHFSRQYKTLKGLAKITPKTSWSPFKRENGHISKVYIQ